MRRFLTLALPLTLVVAVTACGSDDATTEGVPAGTDAAEFGADESSDGADPVVTDAASGDEAGTEESDTAGSTPGAAGTFPATVETAFGDVTVDEAPERIVALGWGDSETVLALGLEPVGASDWIGFGGNGVGPWADGLYTEDPEVLDVAEVNFEAIVALEPDLILNVRGNGDPDEHELLAQIAPTVGIPEGGEAFLTTQEQQVTMISSALGVPEEGAALLADVDEAFAAVADAHPDWDGKTVSAATRFGDVWGGYIEGEGRLDFLQQLGFVQNPAIADIEADGGFYATVSPEQLEILDADLIVVFPIGLEMSVITDDPLYQAIPAVADGRSVIVDGDLASAYSLNSTLSAVYALEQIEPLIADALGS